MRTRFVVLAARRAKSQRSESTAKAAPKVYTNEDAPKGTADGKGTFSAPSGAASTAVDDTPAAADEYSESFTEYYQRVKKEKEECANREKAHPTVTMEQQIADARRRAAAAHKEVDETIPDEVRRAGALPGWLR